MREEAPAAGTPRVEGSGRLSGHLDAIAGQLQDKGLRLARWLRPGLKAKRIEALLETYPYRLPREVHRLYRWRNGSWLPFQLVPEYHFLSLGRALKLYRHQIQVAHEVAEDWEEVWDPCWFPIFACDSQQLLIVKGQEEDTDSSPIYGFFSQSPELDLKYASLTAMMAETADAYRSGAYFADPGGIMTVDEPKLAEVRRRHGEGRLEEVVEAVAAGPTAGELRSLRVEIEAFKDPRTVAPLIELLAGGDPDQQWQAASLLGEIQDPRAIEPLLEALDRAPVTVAEAAATAIGQIPSPRSAESLLDALGRVRPRVQGSVALALARLGETRAEAPVLALALGGQSLEARCGAVAALRILGSEETLRRLEPVLEERPPLKLRIQILRALSDRRIGDHRPISFQDLRDDPELLAQARADAEAENDPAVRHARLQALELGLRHIWPWTRWLAVARSVVEALFRR